MPNIVNLNTVRKFRENKKSSVIHIRGWLPGAEEPFNRNERKRIVAMIHELVSQKLKLPEFLWNGGPVVTLYDLEDKISNGFPNEYLRRKIMRWIFQSVNGVDESSIIAGLPQTGKPWHLIRLPSFYVENYYGRKTKRPKTDQELRCCRISHRGKNAFAILFCDDDHPLYIYELRAKINQDKNILIAREKELERITNLKLDKSSTIES
jgi:hypothetical protein